MNQILIYKRKVIYITEIKVNGTQEFMGINIPIIEGGFGEDCKCISDKTISEIHNQPNREIRRRISDNIKRFKENVDFIDLNKGVGESHTLDLTSFGYTKQSITQAKNIYLLSERGYAKLIKIMDTDLAWEIHDKLMDEYFSMRQTIKEVLNSEDLAMLKICKASSIEETALAINEYREVVVRPLLNTIEKQEPLVGLAELRIDKMGCFSITDVTRSLNLKRGQITNWAKENGFIHKTIQEVNKAGEKLFKIYSKDGIHNSVGITEEGLRKIKLVFEK